MMLTMKIGKIKNLEEQIKSAPLYFFVTLPKKLNIKIGGNTYDGQYRFRICFEFY